MQGARGGSLAFSAAMCYNGQNIRTEDNMDFTVDQTCDGRTLRDYLRRTLCVSSALLTALKAAGSITVDGAPVTVMVVPTNEELMIAQDTAALVNAAK